MGGRSSPPLFELLNRGEARGGGGAGGAGGAGGSGGDGPAGGFDGGGERRGDEDAERRALVGPDFEDEREITRTARLAVTIPTAYGLLAAAIAALVLVYVVGYRIGVDKGRADAEMAYGLAGGGSGSQGLGVEGGVVEPDRGGGGLAGQDTERVAGASESGARAGGRPVAGETGGAAGGGGGAAAYIGPEGPLASDPREASTNYLALATLTRDEAEATLRFLRGEGLEAVAVAVDPGRLRGNSSDRFRLFSLGLAVPSGRFGSMEAERLRHERRVRQLGEAWLEAGGASDFRSPLWERFGG